ncbi:glycosyltransferase family 2 protein [Winogradskyella eckloniae]|uniref:glycosyltransferase family 2 protein n=1 Tax=Winogradskyella eckloniae TaxID=1089306 RepID=UPI0015631159|nr:glycosyltransferase family 2 protein [Winogradskyella eckloniae]NRD20554.1 glycosyltransferase family 2 protein [Winogradskyella eckloniae]
MNPLVSIILPNYNHASFLQERLDSIFNQTYSNIEVIILDDCSTDNSLELLEAYKNHPRVSHFIVNSKNTGSPFKQWQKGFNLAKGDFIWIAESDDKAELNFIEKQLEAIQLYSSDVVVAKTLNFNEKGVFDEVNHPVFRNNQNEILNLQEVLYCPILNVSAVIFKSHLCKFAKTFTGYNIIGDRVFYHEAFLNYSITKNDSTISYFRKSGDSVSTLSNRSKTYYKNYFLEHLKFIKHVKQTSDLSNELYNTYVTRFFNRARYRMSRKEKLNTNYLKMYITYKLNLKRSK